LEQIFKHISYYRRIDYGHKKKVEKICISIGKYWPRFWIMNWYFLGEGEISREEYHINWLMRRPDNEELKSEFLNWEIHAIEMLSILKEFKEYENITFGSSSKTEYRIYNFYRGKALHSGKNKYLNFSLAKKYDPLINANVRDAIRKNLVEWPSDFDPSCIKRENLMPDSGEHEAFMSYERDIETFRWELYNEFKEIILTWAKDRKTEIPAQYFKISLKGFITELFRKKDHSTTARKIYCDPEKEDDWYHCRYKFPKDNINSPDCQHREGFLCKNQERKRIRVDKLHTNSISTEGDIVGMDGEGEKRTYPDKLVSRETEGSVDEEILSHVVSDEKDWEILYLLKEFGECDYSEIGRRVGLSDNGVRRRIEKYRGIIKTNFPDLLEGVGIHYK